MPYALLKITGPHVTHGKLPGTEFWVKLNNDGLPTHPLWQKRLVEEYRDNIGAVTVLQVQDALPDGESALDAGGTPVQTSISQRVTMPLPMAPNTDALEGRILDAVAQALAGIRKEIPAPLDTADLMSRVRQEIEKATAAATRALNDERVRLAVINDAWRVRINLPSDWKSGDPLNFVPPPVIEAYAIRNHGGDVGEAAMSVTKQDDEWHQRTADLIRENPVVSGLQTLTS